MTDRPTGNIARRAAYATGAQVAILVFGFAGAALAARVLGPEGRGILVLAGLLPIALTGLLSFGLGPALSFLVGKRRFGQSTLVTSALIWSVVLGGGTAVAAYALRDLVLGTILRGLTPADLAWVVTGMPAGFAMLFFGALLVGLGRIQTLSYLQVAGAANNVLALLIAVILYGPDPHKVIVVTWFLSYALAIAYWVLLDGHKSAELGTVPAATMVAVPYGLRMAVGQVVYLVYLRADSFFLNYYSGVAIVGVYSIAVTLAEKIWAFSGAATQSAYHDIATRDRAAAAELAARMGRLTLLLSSLAALGLAAASPLIPWVFGPGFEPAIPVLFVLMPGIVLSAVGNVYSSFYMGQLGRPGMCSISSGISAAIAVVLYVALIPRWGSLGAATASSISYALSLLFWMVVFPRETGLGRATMIVPQKADVTFLLGAAGRAGTVIADRFRGR